MVVQRTPRTYKKLPDPISRISWDNYITMNPADMLDQGYETRTAQETPAHLAKVLAGGQEVTLPVVAAPGQSATPLGLHLVTVARRLEKLEMELVRMRTACLPLKVEM